MADAKKETDAKKEGGKKLDLGLILGGVFAALVLGILGFGLFQTYKATLAYQAPSIREPAAEEQMKAERAEEEKGQGALLFTMEPFNVNLAGSPRRVIRLQMALEMLDEDGFEEVVRLGPAARDKVVHILNNKEYGDVETIQGKLFLKDEIAVALNKSLKSGVIKDIFFSEFVIQ